LSSLVEIQRKAHTSKCISPEYLENRTIDQKQKLTNISRSIPNAQEEIVCSIIFNSTDLKIEIHPARTKGVNKSK